MKPFLYIDPSRGVSADMLLAALLDLGVPAETIEAFARRVVPGRLRIRAERVRRRSMGGLRLWLHVRLRRPLPRAAGDVVRAVERSPLPAAIRSQTARAWKVLARAEGRVHGVGWRRVRFRQVGGVDTWACFAGFCAGLARLGVKRVFVGPVRLGMYHRDHGGRPSRTPGPATLRLLKPFRLQRKRDRFEWTTPTGAALLAAFGTPAAPPAFRVLGIGHGFGHARAPGGPRALRLILADVQRKC